MLSVIDWMVRYETMMDPTYFGLRQQQMHTEFLWGKSLGKWMIGRPRMRFEAGGDMNIREVGLRVGDEWKCFIF